MKIHVVACLRLLWKHFCEKNGGEGMALKSFCLLLRANSMGFLEDSRTEFYLKSMIFKR